MDFFSMLIGKLGAGLLRSILVGKALIRDGEWQGIIRAGKDFNAISSFD